MKIKYNSLQPGDRVKLFDGAFGWATVRYVDTDKKNGMVEFVRPYVPLGWHTEAISNPTVSVEVFRDHLCRDTEIEIER